MRIVVKYMYIYEYKMCAKYGEVRGKSKRGVNFESVVRLEAL